MEFLRTGTVSKEDWIEKKMRKMHRDELKNQIKDKEEKDIGEKAKVPEEDDWLRAPKVADEEKIEAPAWVKESKAPELM